MSRTRIKGFETVEPWGLKRERLDRRRSLRGAVGDIIEDAAEDVVYRLPQREE
jgi:hypothetical protein